MLDLNQLVENLVRIIPSFENLLVGVCYLIGLIFIFNALRLAARRQELGPGQIGWSAPLSNFVIGVAFVALPTTLSAVNVSLFNQATTVDPNSIFEYAPHSVGTFGEDAAARTLLAGIVAVIQFIGLIGFARGLYLVNAAYQGPGSPRSFGPGLTFIIGGACAVNFPIFVGLIESLFAG